MTDLPGVLELEFAKELIKAVVAGGVELVRKVPALFRRQGEAREIQASAELDRTEARLAAAAGSGLSREIVVQEATWETLARGLLADHPELAPQLQQLTREIREALEAKPEGFTVYHQRNEGGSAGAMGPNATATVHNYGGTAQRTGGEMR
ncbi:hypothetical protein [Longispora albida]|uniref:hypothetical protein n=1 Tax=Longispora albida TaxID=203523 RepID=UPI0003688811|nr:hypothetical protein [Longispora albida]